jgi:uncharacterized membrane-anchored protein
MHNKKILLVAFILIAVVQLFIPAKMILDREDVLATGKEYKFQTAPIDPNDPFRGKYVALQFKENVIVTKDSSDWITNETIYITFKTDQEGFASIKSVSKKEPTDSIYYLKAKVNYLTNQRSNRVIIDYPFDRYYMDESKAKKAELIYIESQIDTNQVAYALINIKNGDAVLKDVLINEIPIKELVNKNLEKD